MEISDDEEKIPGIDKPFRPLNPIYPPNLAVVEKARTIDVYDTGLDCSEIAEDLLKVANGQGYIIQIQPIQEKRLILYELGKKEPGFYYHQVYTDGRYIYDPRLSADPVPKGDWEKLMKFLNPNAMFQRSK
jgi:filamentous hemagglutinin